MFFPYQLVFSYRKSTPESYLTAFFGNLFSKLPVPAEHVRGIGTPEKLCGIFCQRRRKIQIFFQTVFIRNIFLVPSGKKRFGLFEIGFNLGERILLLIHGDLNFFRSIFCRYAESFLIGPLTESFSGQSLSSGGSIFLQEHSNTKKISTENNSQRQEEFFLLIFRQFKFQFPPAFLPTGKQRDRYQDTGS